jgi:hypothetical protein
LVSARHNAVPYEAMRSKQVQAIADHIIAADQLPDWAFTGP